MVCDNQQFFSALNLTPTSNNNVGTLLEFGGHGKDQNLSYLKNLRKPNKGPAEPAPYDFNNNDYTVRDAMMHM